MEGENDPIILYILGEAFNGFDARLICREKQVVNSQDQDALTRLGLNTSVLSLLDQQEQHPPLPGSGRLRGSGSADLAQ